ncbi:hypothetical protein CA951_02675 [Rhodococcus sp. NCIMB 12038]|nr:hypothetical protein CA951_02675 [Rhodococcus sp. NCIMB 12038]
MAAEILIAVKARQFVVVSVIERDDVDTFAENLRVGISICGPGGEAARGQSSSGHRDRRSICISRLSATAIAL